MPARRVARASVRRMDELTDLLRRAATAAAAYRASLPERAVVGPADVAAVRGRPRRPAAGRADAARRGARRPASRAAEPGLVGNGGPAVLRLRHRRRAARRHRGRHARRRLGPVRVQRRAVAGRGRRRGGRRRLAEGAARASRRRVGRVRHRRRRRPTPSASPRRGTTCWPTPAGTSSATGCWARRAVRVVAGEERHATIDRSLRLLGLRASAPSSRSPPTPTARSTSTTSSGCWPPGRPGRRSSACRPAT